MQLQQLPLEPVLLQLSLRDLIHLSQVSKSLHSIVMAAPGEAWQQAAKHHMPWHPALKPGLPAARAAVQKYAASTKSLLQGKCSVAKEWEIDIQAQPVELHTDSFLFPSGDMLASPEFGTALRVDALLSGEQMHTPGDPEQVGWSAELEDEAER